jgi:hypothetical protein
MVNGYTTIRESFAPTPSNDNVNKLTNDITKLEKELKKKKDELVLQIKNNINSKNKMTKTKNKEKDTTLDEEMDEEDTTLDEEMGEEDTTLDEEMDEKDTTLDEEMDEKDTSLDEEMDEEDTSLDDEVIIEEGFKINEAFNGSNILFRKYFSNLLKAVLLSLIYYLLSSKDVFNLTIPLFNIVKNVMSHLVLHSLIFLLLAYLIISFTF